LNKLKTNSKGKFFDIISNALVNENSTTPGYISLINAIKNKAKDKMENKDNTNVTNISGVAVKKIVNENIEA
jgi:hypothetical protein